MSMIAWLRGSEALAKLPETERKDWQKLWDDVAETLRRASDMLPRPQAGDRER